MLLGEGADIESKDKDGRTPLSWAAERRYESVVKLLPENGADINAKDESGQTPLLSLEYAENFNSLPTM